MKSFAFAALIATSLAVKVTQDPDMDGPIALDCLTQDLDMDGPISLDCQVRPPKNPCQDFEPTPEDREAVRAFLIHTFEEIIDSGEKDGRLSEQEVIDAVRFIADGDEDAAWIAREVFQNVDQEDNEISGFVTFEEAARGAIVFAIRHHCEDWQEIVYFAHDFMNSNCEFTGDQYAGSSTCGECNQADDYCWEETSTWTQNPKSYQTSGSNGTFDNPTEYTYSSGEDEYGIHWSSSDGYCSHNGSEFCEAAGYCLSQGDYTCGANDTGSWYNYCTTDGVCHGGSDNQVCNENGDCLFDSQSYGDDYYTWTTCNADGSMCCGSDYPEDAPCPQI